MSEDPLVPNPRPRFAQWLLDPMRRNSATYARVAVAAVMINLFGLAASLFSMTVYDRVIPNDAFDSLTALSIGLVIVVCFDFTLRMLRAYFVDLAGASIDHDVGGELFARLLHLRLDPRTASQGTVTGLMRELESLRDFFASATLCAVVDLPFIVLTLAVIALIGGWVVMVPIVLIPVVVLAGWLSHPAMDRLSARVLSDGLDKQSVLIETIAGLETVKAVGAGPMLLRRWLVSVKNHARGALQQRLVSAIAINLATAVNTLSYAGVVIVGANLIASHSMTTGSLVACSILSSRAIAPLTQIAALLSRFASTRTAYRQLDALMRLPTESGSAGKLVPAALKGRVELNDVTFRYRGSPVPAVRNISFVIEPGEHVALVGRVGSGKSTVARLMLGLCLAETGSVLIDGADIQQYDMAALRRNFGAIMQDSTLFSGSVRDNILLDRDLDDDEMLRVAEISGTQQAVGSLANGYQLSLADRGIGLSGGQLQSIAIARSLAGRPSILLFDEPTSAMDGQTEAQLIERLRAEGEGRTMVLITHRPALLSLVDRMLVFESGRIVADGGRDLVLRKLMGVQAA